jgi:HYR domain/Cohesin domain
MKFGFAFIACAALAASSAALGQTMTASGSATTKSAGTSAEREFVVNINLADFTGAVGAQAYVAYDSAVVEFVGAAAGDDFSTLIFSQHDSANSKVFFATGVDPSAPSSGISAGNIAKLTFRTIASACSNTTGVSMSSGAIPSRVTNSSGAVLAYTSANSISITSLDPFSLAGVPANVSVAADAGTTSGSLQTLVAPTASDSCGNALTVSASRDDSAVLSAYYPVGTTTITYSASDAAGNSASANVTVTVANYQLLDAAFSFVGSITGSSSRSMRLSYGAASQVVSVSMTNGAGSGSNIQLPVASAYACMTSKDGAHSLSDAAAASVSGVKYSASFVMKQGDSNDDNFVDILDFGIYVGDFGAANPGDVSNFNDDSAVNNGDFSYIALNFAQSGEVCGAFNGGAPRTAVSVRELRRAGLGHLASADLNADGILDSGDIAYYMQNGPVGRKTPSVAPNR